MTARTAPDHPVEPLVTPGPLATLGPLAPLDPLAAAAAPAAGADDWVSRKEAAVLMGRSEDTVKRLVKAHRLATRAAGNNTVQVRLADLVRLGKLAPANVPGAGNAAQTLADLRRAEAALAEAREQLAALTGRLDERARQAEQLGAQLAAKDKQIDALHRSLGHLSAAAAGRLGGAA